MAGGGSGGEIGDGTAGGAGGGVRSGMTSPFTHGTPTYSLFMTSRGIPTNHPERIPMRKSAASVLERLARRWQMVENDAPTAMSPPITLTIVSRPSSAAADVIVGHSLFRHGETGK